jgi:hypothetical protein
VLSIWVDTLSCGHLLSRLPSTSFCLAAHFVCATYLYSTHLRCPHLQSNMFLEDEAAEEEEEGAQAGLGDFGFGVTSNIREHDEEMVS